MKIGVVGLGKMGLGIAENLLKTGHEVTVWNRSQAPVKAMVAKGARAAKTLADAAQGEFLISMLASDAVMRELGFEDTLLDQCAKGLIHVNMATISVALAKSLAAAHKQRGLGYVAAPVFGRPDSAIAGQMLIVTAGERVLLARLDPLFAAMGRRTEVVGDRPEQASLFKIAGNFMIANALDTMSESFALLAKGGVDPKRFHEILTGALFAGVIYQNYGRLVLEKQFDNPGFFLRLRLKDVQLAAEAGKDLGVPLPLAGVLIGHLEEAVAAGLGEQDWTAVSALIAQKAGL